MVEDTLNPYQSVDFIRFTARALVLDKAGRVAYLRLKGEDSLGYHDYYQSPGGGIEWEESLHEGLKRELLEECGFHVRNIESLGLIYEFYHPLGKLSLQNYYVCELERSEDRTDRTDVEKALVQEIVWLDPFDAIRTFMQVKNELGLFVSQRELLALTEYLASRKPEAGEPADHPGKYSEDQASNPNAG